MLVLKKPIWSKYPYGPARTRPHEYTHTVGPYAYGLEHIHLYIDDIQIRPSVGVKIDGKKMFIQMYNKIIKLSKQCNTLCSFIDIPSNCV